MTEQLFEAITRDDLEAVDEALADHDRAAIEERTGEGLTPLHVAARLGRVELARMLLERGADPNAIAFNETRATPLHTAVSSRHRDVSSLLLALGASANAIQQDGWTPLHFASSNGDEDIAGLLLLRGADPTRPADDGRTAIDMARENGHGALAEFLHESVHGRFPSRHKPKSRS
jgi:ankyrin repeat protein